MAQSVFELFSIDHLLTDEDRAVRATVAAYVDKTVRPHVAE